MPPLFEVRQSPIHGRGVYALRRLRTGQRLIEYVGERITLGWSAESSWLLAKSQADSILPLQSV